MSDDVKAQRNAWKRQKRQASKTLKSLIEEELTGCVISNQTAHLAKRPVTDDCCSSVQCDKGLFDSEVSETCINHHSAPGLEGYEGDIQHEEERDEEEFYECVENINDEEDFYECVENINVFDYVHDDLGNPFADEDFQNLKSLLDEDCDGADTLKSDLVVWALEFKIGRNALTSLLHILRGHNHPELPLSSKTLLKTPRSTVKMFKTLGEGLFWYYGILVNLLPRLTEDLLGKLNENIVQIDIFVDGVSPYKSVKKVLWPICGSLAGSKDIFIIAMWCGKTKEPGSLSLFLEDFITEAKELMSAGFTYLGYNFKLALRNIIADAPARTWLKNVNQHGSYNACERCTAVGQWIANRMTYHPREETEPRTDESVRKQLDKRYHKGPTPLTKLDNLSLIGQMPLEPMHLLFLGVMKRILLQLMGQKRNNCQFKFSDSLRSTVDSISEYISQFYPSDFARKPRKWTDCALFKATELRRILLYDGFVLLKVKGVSKKVYNNYLYLACAVRILSDPMFVKDFVDDAALLLKTFVDDSVTVYGQKFNVYNVHHLKHLAEECKRHGDLENFSAFKYESHLGVLKRLLHAPGRTLSQIVCRLLEQVANRPPYIEQVKHEVSVSGPCELPDSFDHLGKGYSSIFLPKLEIQLQLQSFFLSCDQEIVQLSSIIKTNESFLLVGKKFTFQTNYFTSPFPSSTLGIYKVNVQGKSELFTANQVFKKCVVVPIPSESNRPSAWSEGPCLALPMPHGGD